MRKGMGEGMGEKPAWLRPHGTPWIRHSERPVYENPWMAVTEHRATAPTGNPALYGVVHFKNMAMAILPIHDDGTVMLVGQHRFARPGYSWEVPEGGGALDVDPLDSAKRELAEETGLQAAEWREVLTGVELSNSITDEIAYGYLATGLSPAADRRSADETEVIAVARVPFREALDVALAGGLKDMLTVAMLLRAYHMAREGALPGALSRAMLG